MTKSVEETKRKIAACFNGPKIRAALKHDMQKINDTFTPVPEDCPEPPKAYRFIPKYATEEQKANPACWSVMISKPSQQWIDGFIVEELR